MSKILVCGVQGFVGHHLARELSSNNHTVIGTGLGENLDPTLQEYVSSYVPCDLSDASSVAELPLEDVDAVINLAGLAQVGASFDNEEVYMKTNVEVQTNIVERLQQLDRLSVRVLAISTGAVYSPDQEMPLTEESLLTDGGSPYAQSKIAMEKAVLALRDQGSDVIIARPFNHIGPGQQPGFLLPDLATQIQESIANETYEITVGNLASKRDYTDVRDVVRAYHLLATADSERLSAAVYNVCSGRSVAGQEILNELVAIMSPAHEIAATIDESRLRPHDPKELFGSNDLLENDSGWQPEIGLPKTIEAYVEWLVTSKQS